MTSTGVSDIPLSAHCKRAHSSFDLSLFNWNNTPDKFSSRQHHDHFDKMSQPTKQGFVPQVGQQKCAICDNVRHFFE